MDTVIWLLNFPATHGYAMIFIAGFSLMGLAAMSFRSTGGASMKLRVIRDREGLPETAATSAGPTVFARLQRAGFRVLSLVMLAGLVLGILGLTGVPVTAAYIHANGVPTTATLDGGWVTFTTPDGKTYTLGSDFFTPAQYPDRNAMLYGDQAVVRYLPDHPQAFVIDSEQPSTP